MAMFDQLAADQRAIIEIVLRQDRSYDQIGELLDLPPARVRELAREALAELAPFTADFVDAQWRGQLADYVLGQQTGPEAQATRGHLKRSEPARIWTYSLLDALDDFFADGDRPDIPVGESAGRAGRAREKAPLPVAAAADAPADAEPAQGNPLAASRRRARGGDGWLSPAARTALMRRRIAGAVGGLIVVGLIVWGAIALFGGGNDNSNKTQAAAPAAKSSGSSANQQGQVVAQAALVPVGNFKGTAAAIVYQSGKQAIVVVKAKLPPSSGNKKYVLWLYNSDKKLLPLAADVTDKQGNFSGAAGLPSNWQKYKFLDMTYQATSGKNIRHGTSVMQGPFTAPTAQTSTGTGTTTTP